MDIVQEIKETEKVFANYVLKKLFTIEKKNVGKQVKDQKVPMKRKAKSLNI